jgi:subtilisin-like proprotein convertase family protein
MRTMKTTSLLTTIAGLVATLSVSAQTAPETNVFAVRAQSFSQAVQFSTNYVVNLPIPDNNASGVASTREFSTPLQVLGDVNVTLDITGNFNGDLYAYLTHSSGLAVLLNRVGRTTVNDLGYSDAGMKITLDDSAPNGDVHSYRLTLSGNANSALDTQLTGVWAPDARATDPANVRDTDPRAALSALQSFYTLNPNGKWTLFVADLSPGGTSTLNSWGLEVSAIPEPTTWALLGIGSALLLANRKRKS